MKPFTIAALVVFAMIAIGHALRLAFGWDVAVSGAGIPSWVSIVGLLIATGLGFGLWWEVYAPKDDGLSHRALDNLVKWNDKVEMNLSLLDSAFPRRGGVLEDEQRLEEIRKVVKVRGHTAEIISHAPRNPPSIRFQKV